MHVSLQKEVRKSFWIGFNFSSWLSTQCCYNYTIHCKKKVCGAHFSVPYRGLYTHTIVCATHFFYSVKSLIFSGYPTWHYTESCIAGSDEKQDRRRCYRRSFFFKWSNNRHTRQNFYGHVSLQKRSKSHFKWGFTFSTWLSAQCCYNYTMVVNFSGYPTWYIQLCHVSRVQTVNKTVHRKKKRLLALVSGLLILFE